MAREESKREEEGRRKKKREEMDGKGWKSVYVSGKSKWEWMRLAETKRGGKGVRNREEERRRERKNYVKGQQR